MAANIPSAAVQGREDASVGANSAALADAPRTGVNAPNEGQKKKQICRFFNSKNGCRAGDACPFVHASPSQRPPRDETPKPSKPRDNRLSTSRRQYEPPPVDGSRVVTKPVPKAQLEDPREFQVGQIRRRFAPTEEAVGDGTLFRLKLAPSDPDFPFDLPFLECDLTVPAHYPQDKATLRITNTEMPRGFQLNVERGFDRIIAESPNATLLGVFNRLDKQLETLLSSEKAETVKIIRNTPRPESQINPPAPKPPKPVTSPRPPPVELFTSEQKSQAQQKRQVDIRQLVARLGRLPGFNQSSDGITFTVPFQPLKKPGLPESLQNQNTVRLVVPELYNLPPHPPRMEIVGNNDPAAKALEQAFQERARNEPKLGLLAHINYMTLNAHTMVIPKNSPAPPALKAETPVEPEKPNIVVPISSRTPSGFGYGDSDRPHLHVIPRPPEWNDNGQQDWSSDDDSLTYDSGDETEDDALEGTVEKEQASASLSGLAERGILMSFPHLELYGCELLELVSLNVTVKCERCKDTLDVQRLRNNTKGDAPGMRDEICKKCANSLAVGFRADLLHQNSIRAGYLDLDGCTIVDMLPSNFVPTCSECSTSYPAPGVVGVRGDSVLAICRECHRKMSFRIPEIKFLQVSASAVRASRAPVRRKVKENLGIVAGQELPKRGRCTHYAKSYRWFRFSCCSKVYPCDRCHDENESHPNEHANRMICGYCSREQNYHPEHCHICRTSLIRKAGSGFWEGGKGTRDRLRMSRKDPRKYKRRPGTKPSGN